ncbi:MAG TPA: DinB family protein [Bryobacteraceae bacterium]|nr:DinB family protein [Bryobacteraceae bacterium]
MSSAAVAVDGQPLVTEAIRLLEHIRERAVELSPRELRDRVRAAANGLEKEVSAISDADAHRRPFPQKWSIAEVTDHIAQTQIRSAEEIRHLLAGRRPPGPPVYDALHSGAPSWAPWPELIDGLRSANQELVGLLSDACAAPDLLARDASPTARTVLVVNHALHSDSATMQQTFVAELEWREYALVQRLHLIEHREQVKRLRSALSVPDPRN